MKTLTIAVTYNSDTRVLETNTTLTGFIPGLPDKAITGKQVDSITLFSADMVSSGDVTLVSASQGKAMLTCTKELAAWLAATINKDKAYELPGAPEGGDGTVTFDLVAAFEAALNN